jgi:copper homeostasis protein
MIFEVCVDSIEGVIAAREGGAQRVELCAGLVEGGVTPSPGMLRLACGQDISVYVLVRPRGGDFVYTDFELEVMRQDIAAAKMAGASGVVLGALLVDGRLDVPRMRELIGLARPLGVTCHRAFDLCRDPDEALDTLIELGVERLLTSGQRPTALEGAACIAELVRRAAGRISVMAGGGVNAHNLADLLDATGVNEAHFTARSPLPSRMLFRNTQVCMGKPYQPDEYTRKVTDLEQIRLMLAAK